MPLKYADYACVCFGDGGVEGSMAILKIDEDYRIVSDPMCWVLQKKSIVQNTDIVENIGKEAWGNEGYYTDLSNAYKGFVDKKIKSAHSLNGVMKKLDELHKLIETNIPNLAVNIREFEVLQDKNKELHMYIAKLKKMCEKIESPPKEY